MDTINVTADADTLCRRAASLIDAGRIEVAQPLLAAARMLAPPSPELFLLAARIASGRGAWEQALLELDSGVAIAPSRADLRRFRADVRLRMSDLEGAARDAAEAVIFDPRDPQAKAILGAAMLRLGHETEAIACLAESVAEAPKDLASRQGLAAALEQSGNIDGALATLTNGIALRPGSQELHNAAILLCIRRRDFTQAVRLGEQARSLGSADASTFAMTGHALCNLGRHDEALIAYQDGLKLDPEDRHMRLLVVLSGLSPDLTQAPEDYIRTLFDSYATDFEDDLISMKYAVPGTIRSIVQNHPKIVAGLSLGPVLDLGCGTGFVAVVIADLPLGPITGVDLSPRMLDHARAKQLYTELRQGDILTDMETHPDRWPLIIAAEVLCYFGPLEDTLARVHESLEPGGWFIFSVEELLPDHDGVVSGNGNWMLQRGRYAHAAAYVCETACAAGFRVVRTDRLVVRQEAGINVAALLLTLERVTHVD